MNYLQEPISFYSLLPEPCRYFDTYTLVVAPNEKYNNFNSYCVDATVGRLFKSQNEPIIPS